MGPQEPFQGLDGPCAALVGADRHCDRFPAGKLPLVVERVTAVDEVLEVAVYIKVVGRGTDHEDLAGQDLLHNLAPVVVPDHAPLVLLALLAPQAGLDLFSRKGNELGRNLRLLAPLEDGPDEESGVPFLALAPAQP